MASDRALVIDASPPGDIVAGRVRAEMLDVLAGRGDEVSLFVPDARRLAHCIGCFHCWVEAPGVCRYSDGIADLFRAVVQSDTVAWLEQLRFGGHSAALKQVLDRMLGLMLPDFVLAGGELSHPPRYPRPPRLIGIALAESPPSPEEVALYSAVVGRNARNLHARSHTAAVLFATDDPAKHHATLVDALTRDDTVPSLEEIARLVPGPTVDANPAPPVPGHVLLLVGSPRQLSASTSLRLGERVLGGLMERGWTSEVVTAGRGLRHDEGERALLEAWDRADLVLIVSPIYLDTPPCLLTAALEAVARHARTAGSRPGQRLVAICNSSFPQAAQSSLALAVCARFAAAVGIAWAGGLALGGGAWIEGQPLEGRGRPPLPTRHVLEALDLTAAALALGLPVPAEAASGIARVPFRGLPFWLWQRLYGSLTARVLRARAARNGIGPEIWAARPFAGSTGS
jgi:multimeric flavodoxin WrbA